MCLFKLIKEQQKLIKVKEIIFGQSVIYLEIRFFKKIVDFSFCFPTELLELFYSKTYKSMQQLFFRIYSLKS